MNAKELIEEIQAEKKSAIKEGTLREEKTLEPITDRDIPRRLPEGWEWCRLGDYAMKVTDYVASGSFASLKENVLITNDENYAVMVKTADFSNGFSKNLTYTDEHGYKFLENSNLYGGELILSNIGSIGKVFIVPDLKRPMTLASNTVMVRMTHNEYNKYMYYMFKSPFGQGLLMSISSGTSMLKFNKTQLKSTIIPIAPLEEQFKICDVLDKVQGVIDKRERELEDLDNLIKARFVELFGNINEDRFPKCKLRDVAHIKHGYAFSGEYFSDDDNGVVLVTPGNFALGGGFQEVRNRYFTAEYPDEYVLHAGDLIVTMTDLSKKADTLGYGAIVPDNDKVYLHNQRIGLFDKLDKTLNPVFVRWFMQTDEYRLEIVRTSTGSTVHHTSPDRILDSVIYLPPIEMQNNFISFAEQVDKSKVAVQKSLEETQLLFDSLMQKYFG